MKSNKEEKNWSNSTEPNKNEEEKNCTIVILKNIVKGEKITDSASGMSLVLIFLKEKRKSKKKN
jgi:hypothetical protein